MYNHQVISPVWYAVAGLALLMLMQLIFSLMLLRRTRRRNSSSDYRRRFLLAAPPACKRRALYVSETTYERYFAAAQPMLGADKPLLWLTDAILRDHLERYDREMRAVRDMPDEKSRQR